MANTPLTPTMVTREALRVLHQKSNFLGSINRQYDDQYAKTGAKIGDSLKVRLPNQYSVRTGLPMDVQDVTETSTTIQMATVKGVDLNFTSSELLLSIDDFSKRILDPAMSVLAANIEADALSMYKDVYNIVDSDAAAISFKDMMKGRKALNDNLAPMDSSRTALLSTDHTVTLVDALKGLFQDANAIKEQYREGAMGRTAGFDFYENTLVSNHTSGTAAKSTGYTVNGASQTGSTIIITGGSTTFLKGDIVTFVGCNRVHPETKVSTGVLQQFVVTADSGASATSLAISPAIVTSGATQNVSASPTSGGAVVKVAAGASELINSSMVYHKDAFAFVTADLPLPKGVNFAAREVYDGVSMSIVGDFDVKTREFPYRIDVLYGYKTIRPQLACRIHADG